MSTQEFPPGWDEKRTKDLIAHYENQTEDEEFAEIEASVKSNGRVALKIGFGIFGFILILLASVVCFFSVWFRIDTPDDLDFIRILDVVIGFAFGFALLCYHVFATPVGSLRHPPVVKAILVWCLLSGALLVWHEIQVRIRWEKSPSFLALNRMSQVSHALDQFSKDCGSYPTQEQGLRALCNKPGNANKWRGPYVELVDLIDPWGNALEFSVRRDTVQIWSRGPDGVSGSKDDLHWPPKDEVK